MKMIHDPVQSPGSDLQAAIARAVDAADMQLALESDLQYKPADLTAQIVWVDRVFWPDEWVAIDDLRASEILRALAEGEPLPAIRVMEQPILESDEHPTLGQEVGWRIIDEEGFHLYHLARAVGIQHVFCQEYELFDDPARPGELSYRRPRRPTREGLERYPYSYGYNWEAYKPLPCTCVPGCSHPCDGQCGCDACTPPAGGAGSIAIIHRGKFDGR